MLSACGGGSDDGDAGKVQVTCATVSNDPSVVCGNQTAKFSLISSANAAIIVEAATITRSQEMLASTTVVNSKLTSFAGYRVVLISPPPPNAGWPDPWMAVNEPINLAAGSSNSSRRTWWNSAQPLGPTSLTTIVYEGGTKVCATLQDGTPSLNPDGTCNGTVWTGGVETDRALVTYTVVP